ncbi:MAG: heme exporter protein CcmD [Emcibacter sp.]|nr:heme exporter protein CcmD [Emcibacter sp.]MBL4893390.1 heme exporter protein CcmD [Emcibacter sp.]
MTANDMYILLSYGASIVVLVVLAVTSLWTKKKDETILRKLENQMRELSDKQGA